MRTLVAKKALVYNGRNYKIGEEVRVMNAHCVTLIATGLAAEADRPQPPTTTPAPQKRAYRRRDLTAERD